MQTTRSSTLAFVAILGIGNAMTLHAATACVSNLAQLALVLDATTHNGEADEIRIAAGTYQPTGVLSAVMQEVNNLTISGGWNADCSTQDGGQTILDGQNQTLLLHIRSSVATGIGISDISFVNAAAMANGGPGGALGIYTGGLALAQRNIFLANSYGFSSAAFALVGGTATVAINNLVVANHSAMSHAAASVSCGTDPASFAEAFGNTIVNNDAAGNGSTGGLEVDCLQGSAYVANNLLWNNEGSDLQLVGVGTTTLYDNDIGVQNGDAASMDSGGNFSAAPIYAGGLLNFRLASSSPTTNRGRNCIVGGIGCEAALGYTDLAGAPRIQGARVDIGAYESDVLLYSGFESMP